jgi:hypothetical protein
MPSKTGASGPKTRCYPLHTADLVDRLGRLPEVEPPLDFSRRVMGALSTRSGGRFASWKRKLLSPVTVTFTPIKWAPAMVGLLLVAALLLPSLLDHGPASAPGEKTSLVTLRFSFENPRAHSVALIGTFNNWSPEGYRMQTRGHRWVYQVQVEPGRYDYAFLVDGRRVVPDPNARFSRKDGFGRYNSVVWAGAEGHGVL